MDPEGPVRIDELGEVASSWERGLFLALRGDAAVEGFGPEDWRGVGEVAVRTHAAALLHAVLRERRLLDAVPDEVAVRLGRARAWGAARWKVAVAQARRIGGALAAEGIPCLALKGAHIGLLYDAVGARPLGDLDLLVRPADLASARRVLLGLGYAEEPGWADDHPDHRHLPPLRVAGGLPVELHHTLAERAGDPDPAEEVWARAAPLDHGLLGMAPVDALLYTCAHLAVHHRFGTANGLAGLADLGALLARHRVDPAELAGLADARGLRPATALCLHLARDLLGAPVPPDLLDAVRVPGVEGAAPSAVWLLLHVGTLGALRPLELPARPTLSPPPTVLAVRGGRPLRAVWTWTRAAALPPADDLRLDHPRLGRAGYPVRWTRLAWRHAGLVRALDPARRAEVRARRAAHAHRLDDFLGSGAPSPGPGPRLRGRDLLFLARAGATTAAASVLLGRAPLPLTARLVARGGSPLPLPPEHRVVALTDRLLALDIGPLRPRCTLRSLVLLRYLRGGGAVVLKTGIRPGVRPVEGHAWVERDGRPVAEREDPRRAYTVTWSWP